MVSGLAAIGYAVVGAVAGAGAVGAVGTLAAVAIGAVTSAIVGAAVGGLIAAVSGGDIGKGMLYGAIGGVVVGGVAGGALAGGAGGTAAAGGSGSGALIGSTDATILGLEGTTTGLTGGMGETLVSVGVKETGTGSLFGGTFGTAVVSAAVPSLLDFAADGLTESKVQKDWGKTKAGILATLASQERRAAAANKGHAPAVWASTQAGVTYQREQDYKLNERQGEQRLVETKQEYKLANEGREADFDRARGVFTAAASGAANTSYQGASSKTKAAIVASQQEEGQLSPPTTEEVV